MSTDRNCRLERMTQAAWNESPAIARGEQARVLAELAGAVKTWAARALSTRRESSPRKPLACAELH